MAYITAAQFTRLYDSRRVCQLLADTGTPVAAADLAADETLADLLAVASEQIAAAALVGKRYSVDQLAALAASTTTGFLLRKLTADLAYASLVARRGQGAADLDRLCPAYADALRQLEALRLGATLFPGIPNDTHGDAGLPQTVDLDSPTNTHRITKLTTRAGRLFPSDCDRRW
jgi:hypothetical protein